jgi:lipopolysaccharide biosynthesis glycosyltransferase
LAAIALISDEETLRYFPANLQQIKAFGDVGIKVYLITNCESDNPLLARAVVIANNLNLDLSVITIDVMKFSPQYKSSSNRVPAISLMKLFLGELLPDEDLVLYLDIDTVICKSLSTLLNTPISTPVAAVEELSTNRAYFPLEELPEVYFNSGVMLLSLNSLRALGISKKATRFWKIKTCRVRFEADLWIKIFSIISSQEMSRSYRESTINFQVTWQNLKYPFF